jgi:hypothetical protein
MLVDDELENISFIKNGCFYWFIIGKILQIKYIKNQLE